MKNSSIIIFLINYNLWRRYNGALDKAPKQPDPTKLGKVIDAAIKAIKPAAHQFSVGTKFQRKHSNRIETIIDFNTTRNLAGEIISSEYVCSKVNHAGQTIKDTANHSTVKLATILESYPDIRYK